MLTYRARTSASPATAWDLVARPARWHEWAPHVRGAWGLGEPEVELGARGAARLFGVVPVPARVTAKLAGASWTWQVGPVAMVHAVEPVEAGAEVVVQLHANLAIESALAVSYGPGGRSAGAAAGCRGLNGGAESGRRSVMPAPTILGS